jgi:hypothetical protein
VITIEEGVTSQRRMLNEDEPEHWIILNSWGDDWGYDGLAKFAIEYSGPGVCGFNMETQAVFIDA